MFEARMTIPKVFDTYKDSLDATLKSAFEGRALGIYDMQRYHLGWIDGEGRPANGQGKGLRPMMCLLACQAAGGDWQKALSFAAALELVHNFSLIHDDIQDGDTQRRHRDTVWHKWGLAQGINAGDSMRGLAAITLVKGVDDSHPATQIRLAVEGLEIASLLMIEGQFLDITYERNTDVTTDQYLAMIGRKTGALFGCSFYLGALAAGCDEGESEAWRQLGLDMGAVFQIRDDMLGVWGDEDRLGKPIASDIRRKKMCLPVVHALQSAEGEDRKSMQKIYGNDDPATENQVDEVLGVLERTRAREYCQELAEKHNESAMSRLDGLKLDKDMDSQLRGLARFFLEREH